MWVSYTSPQDIDNLFGEEGNVIGIAQRLGQVGKDRPPSRNRRSAICITAARTPDCTASAVNWPRTAP